MKVSPRLALTLGMISLSLPACQRMHAEEKEQHHEAQNKIVATSPLRKEVVVTQQYVCQIRSQRNIEVRAMQEGYLEAIPVKEGQAVKQGDVMFQVVPALYKARLDAEQAELDLAQLERNNTQRLYEKSFVSVQELALYDAKLNKAKAKLALAQAELKFATVTAPFDGIIDRLQQQQGSLVKKEDLLTTLSDNSVMWVYFNVPEARYFEFKALQGHTPDPSRLELVDARVELRLANGNPFHHDAGNVVTVEGKFNNETGNIAFRADFPNPDRLLRHGQTGTVLIHRRMRNALVIPQRATFEVLDKQYVFVIDKAHVAHQRLITVQNEMDDIFVLKSGLEEGEQIVFEGVREVHDGRKVEFEFRPPAQALSNLKHHAE
jgi:membrane fusion protein, multidrug efflux system